MTRKKVSLEVVQCEPLFSFYPKAINCSCTTTTSGDEFIVTAAAYNLFSMQVKTKGSRLRRVRGKNDRETRDESKKKSLSVTLW